MRIDHALSHSSSFTAQKQRNLLAKQLVDEKNKHLSTVISMKAFHRILQSIDFAVAHAQIESEDFFQLYEDGWQHLQEKMQLTKQVFEKLKKAFIPIENERYLSIFNQQLPDFFANYDLRYHATFCKEDLDYPLLDGLPLEHHMYHLKGIDLVAEYLRRFSLEEELLHIHKTEVSVFFQDYECFYGISLNDLGLNLCEAVLIQLFFSSHLAHSLLITRQQQELLCENLKLMNDDEISAYISDGMITLLSCYPERIQLYSKPFLQQIGDKIKMAIKEGFLERYIIVHEERNQKQLQLQTACDPYLFEMMLYSLSLAKDVEQRITVILNYPLGFHDYLDLFEMDILQEEDYVVLFGHWDAMTLAVLFIMQFQEAFVFHQQITLSSTTLQNIQTYHLWEDTFINYLGNMEDKQKEEILHTIKQLI